VTWDFVVASAQHMRKFPIFFISVRLSLEFPHLLSRLFLHSNFFSSAQAPFILIKMAAEDNTEKEGGPYHRHLKA